MDQWDEKTCIKASQKTHILCSLRKKNHIWFDVLGVFLCSLTLKVSFIAKFLHWVVMFSKSMMKKPSRADQLLGRKTLQRNGSWSVPLIGGFFCGHKGNCVIIFLISLWTTFNKFMSSRIYQKKYKQRLFESNTLSNSLPAKADCEVGVKNWHGETTIQSTTWINRFWSHGWYTDSAV